MSRRSRIVVAVLGLVLVAALSLLLTLNAAVRGFLLDPIVRGIDSVRYIMGYTPQDMQWLLTIAVFFIAVTAYFFARLPQRPIPEPRRPHPLFPTQGPIMKLTTMLEKAGHNRYRREETVLALRDLAARSLSYHHGLSVDEAKEQLSEGHWIQDEEVLAFLSLEKHRGQAQKHARFHDQVKHALGYIERTYSGGLDGTETSQ
jgi:hypothetical protein